MRVWVPPQLSEQALQPLQPPSTGQAWLLHVCELGPEQDVPPFAGAGLVQVRVWVPPLQAAEQLLQPLQPPLTGTGQG